MRVLISGIGRSATTLIYQQIAKCFVGQFESIQFRYEPYLWNIDLPHVKHQPYDMSQISHYGVHVHKSTPLFLADKHEIHDKFIDQLFLDSEPSKTSNRTAFLAKTIRGAGRLESYIRRYPDIRIIACLRNPIDTINSSLGMFSFLGHEFHANDCDRLFHELKTNRNPCIDSHDETQEPTLLQSSIWWWRSLTEETLRVARKYPENFFLFVNETFTTDTNEVTESLMKFLPVIDPEKFHMGLKVNAGPSIKQNHLLAADLELLLPQFEYYCDKVLKKVLKNLFTQDQTDELRQRLLDAVAISKFNPPIAGDHLGQCAPTTLRGIILKNQSPSPTSADDSRTEADVKDNTVDMQQLVRTWCDQNRLCSKIETRYRSKISHNDETFGCVITCHNNEETIRGSLISALEQTRPFDQIIVVDDASNDNSIESISDLVANSNKVEVLELATNVGVSAARHFGIVALNTVFVTHLDGDDYFWPSKNFHEANVVLENPNAIAFSDFLIVEHERLMPIVTTPYNGRGTQITKQFLVRRDGVPRDMTFGRQLYFDVGGYDLRLSLYEDLEFKLRLSALADTTWERSAAPLGTVYNRKNPTLSRNEGLRLSRALTAHFFRHVEKTNLIGLEAAEAYNELLRHYPSDWTQQIFDRLLISSANGIAKMSKSLLSPQIEVLTDTDYVQSIDALCKSDSFDAIVAPWQQRYGVAGKEGPYPGFSQENLYWQVSKSCGFTIQSRSKASGVRGRLYLPHLTEQKLNVVIKQSGSVVQKTFDIQGKIKDDSGNHLLHEVEIPMPLGPGETEISCFAASHIAEQERELFCLFADWQLYC